MSVDTHIELINYYEILEVSPQASADEIYDAYSRVKQTYSPRNPELFKTFNIEELQQLLVLIEEAYSTIGNEKTRKIYDKKLFAAYPELEVKLPSLDFKEDKPVEESKATPKPLPSGHAKTPLSIYPIDDAFEALIESQEFYDGNFLARVRKYKRVKLEDFSQYTCIAVKYLYAIENNNYTALPARVFTQGYIQQYCKVLGLDAKKIIPSFMTLYQNARE